ncbi:MAG: NADH:ubiquinone oxidoreductase [Stictis urceolatum]|nr:NADH:ubiquinone oxidoreductase [Stictis urceolata]
MPGLDDPAPSSSPLSGALSSSASKEDALAFYKAQYEQLEAELADFQASSRDLEAELEKDVEEAEKRERGLKEKVEALNYEVNEWKSKCKQSKSEANDAQNKLQKEITTLRDQNRTLQLGLRDIEVQNDDFERQARNTTSSLEDMESKYSVAIERGVILEGEVKAGEQEREDLRIEVQRLRDELSDLKVEAEIRQDKLRHAEAASKKRKPTPLAATIPGSQSSVSEHSPTATTSSSPTIATPPTKSVSSTTSDAPTPPSPPTSDKSAPPAHATPAHPQSRSRLSITNSATPRPTHYSSRAPRHSRGPSVPANSTLITPASRRTTLNRGDVPQLPSSTSLTQIRGLIGKMQKLEQRVQSARSKLPAPTSTPPKGSPRPGSSLNNAYIPSTITMRSSKKRTSASHNSGPSSVAPLAAGEPTENPARPSGQAGRPSSRLSFGLPPPTPTKDFGLNTGVSRPSSRASLSSRQSISHLPRGLDGSVSRPSSRQSVTGARTPLGHYPTNAERIARPRSSIGGSYASSHGHSQSVSRLSNYGLEESPQAETDAVTPTPSKRATFGKESGTALPLPSAAKRQSGAGMSTAGRRISSGPLASGGMGPPERKKKLSGVGETY